MTLNIVWREAVLQSHLRSLERKGAVQSRCDRSSNPISPGLLSLADVLMACWTREEHERSISRCNCFREGGPFSVMALNFAVMSVVRCALTMAACLDVSTDTSSCRRRSQLFKFQLHCNCGDGRLLCIQGANVIPQMLKLLQDLRLQ